MRGLWLTERAICQRARDLGAAAVRGIITSFPEASVSFLLLFFFLLFVSLLRACRCSFADTIQPGGSVYL